MLPLVRDPVHCCQLVLLNCIVAFSVPGLLSGEELTADRDDAATFTRETQHAAVGTLPGEIVFAVRQRGKDGHWYANFSYYANSEVCDSFRESPVKNARLVTYREGGKLCRLNVPSGQVTTLLDDPQGGVRDPDVHYDAEKILFSYRPGGTEHYHLYEINVDGTGLRQLTDGPYDDIEPTYLPDGDIVFVSSRCKRWVQCWLTQVAVLHRCDADGGNIRAISANLEHDNTPWVLPDGRDPLQRWEYVDRTQVDYHHLWTTNPDGTGQMVYYGNMHPGHGDDRRQADPRHRTRSWPSSRPATAATNTTGSITVVDPGRGPDDRDLRHDDHRASPTSATPGRSRRLPSWRRSGAELVLMDGDGHDSDRSIGSAAEERGRRARVPRAAAADRAARASAVIPVAHRPGAAEPARWCWPTSTRAATWPASSAARSRSCWCWNRCPSRSTSPAAWTR